VWRVEGEGEFDRAARVNLLRMGRAELEYGFIRSTKGFEQAPEVLSGVLKTRERDGSMFEPSVCLAMFSSDGMYISDMLTGQLRKRL
jgi:hypothetical protein